MRGLCPRQSHLVIARRSRGNLMRSPRRYAPRDDGFILWSHLALWVLKIIPVQWGDAVGGEWSSLFAGIIFNTRKVEECAVVVYFPSRFAGILLPTHIVGAGVAGSGRRQNNLCSSGIISLIY